MYPAPFEYVRATSYAEASGLLRSLGEEAKVLAGGQSLIPLMNLRLARPSHLVDIGDLDRGRSPEIRDGWLRLPAQTRQHAIERNPIVARSAPLLAMAAAHTGNVRVRSRGTLGGNLAHGDASSELACAAVALRAVVDVVGVDGEREVTVDDLLVSDFTTSLRPDEVITSVRVPALGPGQGHGFDEMVRRAGEFAIVNASAVVTLDPDGRCVSVRLACGGAGPRIVDASNEAGAELVGRIPTVDDVSRAGRSAAAVSRPRDDHQASAGYRRRMLEVFCRRALADALSRAGATHE